MNGIIKLPQLDWLSWLSSGIVCSRFPISIHCGLFLTFPRCLLLRPFWAPSVPCLPPTLPLFLCLCFFCHPTFPSPSSPPSSILPLTARTCKVSIEPNNTRKWLWLGLYTERTCWDFWSRRTDLERASCRGYLRLDRYFCFLFCGIKDEVMLDQWLLIDTLALFKCQFNDLTSCLFKKRW